MDKIEEINETINISKNSEISEISEMSESNKNSTIQSNQEVKPLSRDELKKKLKHRIKTSSSSRKSGFTKKKSENLQDSLSKVSNVLQEKNIDDPSKIDADLISNIINIINKDDLDLILNKIKDDSKFKNILQQVSEASSSINLQD